MLLFINFLKNKTSIVFVAPAKNVNELEINILTILILT